MLSNNVALAAVDALDACEILFMLVGAYSINAFGVYRSTHDVDIVIDLCTKNRSVTLLETFRRISGSIAS